MAVDRDAEALADLARQLKLTQMQRTFARGLAEGMTQTDAAILAKAREPAVQGSKWAKLAKVKHFAAAVAKLARTRGEQGIAQQTAQALADVAEQQTRELVRAETEIMEAREVQQRLSMLGRSDIGRHLVIDENGHAQIKIDPANTYILREVVTEEQVVRNEAGEFRTLERTKVKVSDPRPSLEALARIHGIDKGVPPVQGTPVNIERLLVILSGQELGQLLEVARKANAGEHTA